VLEVQRVHLGHAGHVAGAGQGVSGEGGAQHDRRLVPAADDQVGTQALDHQDGGVEQRGAAAELHEHEHDGEADAQDG
jgi:hypothetical protein